MKTACEQIRRDQAAAKEHRNDQKDRKKLFGHEVRNCERVGHQRSEGQHKQGGPNSVNNGMGVARIKEGILQYVPVTAQIKALWKNCDIASKDMLGIA